MLSHYREGFINIVSYFRRADKNIFYYQKRFKGTDITHLILDLRGFRLWTNLMGVKV
jgi:hypothetical protein